MPLSLTPSPKSHPNSPRSSSTSSQQEQGQGQGQGERQKKRPPNSKQLSEEEKKLHHIKSEHKRREQIRSTFDTLIEVVPKLDKSEARSELAILSKTSEYIKELRLKNEKLVQLAKQKGIELPNELLE